MKLLTVDDGVVVHPFFSIMKKSLLLITVALLTSAVAMAQTPYVVWCESDSTLYFTERTILLKGTTFVPEGSNEEHTISNLWSNILNGNNYPEWYHKVATCKYVVIESSFSIAKLTSLSHWFEDFYALEKITGIENLNTKDVTTMLSMFDRCYALKSLDLAHFNTASCKNMKHMFQGCESLKELNLSNFDTRNVTILSCMFNGACSLERLDLSNFNTSKVTDMSVMFANCRSLSEVILSNFETVQVTNMKQMFYHCDRIENIDLSDFSTTNVAIMNQMFAECKSLKSIIVSDLWTTDKVRDGAAMFSNCFCIVGGNDTEYDKTHITHDYAHIDEEGYPGYLTSNITSTQPDLIIGNIQANSTNLNPGEKVVITWECQNIGLQPTTGGWTEQVSLVTTDGSFSRPIASFRYEEPLAAKGIINHQEEITLPLLLGIDGSVRLQVEIVTDESTGEPETAKENNIQQSQAKLSVSKKLMLELTPKRIEEGDEGTAMLKVDRSGSWAQAQTFSLSKSSDSRVSLPTTVTIPAEQSGAMVSLSISDNSVLDADSIVNINVSGNDYLSATTQLFIIDNELPKLTVSCSRSEVTEGDEFQLTITAQRAPSSPTTITVGCDNGARFDYPAKVVMPAGKSTVTVSVTAIDDDIISETESAAFTVTAPRYESGEVVVLVNDNDMPDLELSLTPTAVSAGANAILGTIKRKDHLDTKATIVLNDDSNGLLSYSQQRITLKPGEAESKFNISIDGTVSRDRQLQVTAAVYLSACDCTAKEQSGGSITQQLTLLAATGAAISVEPSSTAFALGSDDNAITVTLEQPAARDLTVNVSTNHDNVLSYDHTVTIKAGESSVTIPVTWTSELPEGETITFTASASGYASATCWTTTTAAPVPDATISSFTVSDAEAEAESEVAVTVEVKNTGTGVLSGETPVTISLTGDPYPVTVSIGKDLQPGESATVKTTYQLPPETGDYSLQAVVNANGSVDELLASNNASAKVPVTVNPSFEVTAHTDKKKYGQGEVITVTGKATGSKSAHADVEVYFINDGMRQTKKVKTDAEGNYSTVFLPIDGTSGHFAIGACYPGEDKSVAMTEVDTYGLRAGSYRSSCSVGQGKTYHGSIEITNPGDLPQTGIRAVLTDAPQGVGLNFETIRSLGAGETVSLPFTITANDNEVVDGKQRLTVAIKSNEGALMEHQIECTVEPSQGCLRTDSTAIITNISMGGTRDIPINIWNAGQAPTGDITLTLPSWIQSLTPRQMPSLAPGDSATVVLRITTTDNMHLNIASEGRVGLNCTDGTGLAMTMNVTPVSEQTGTVVIDVTDEITYSTEERPHVAGATVQVVNRSTNAVVAEGVSDADGKFTATVPEGWYRLKVTAANHEPYDKDLLVDPGTSKRKEAFISFNGLTLGWGVNETEVEDEYSIETKMTYESQVPPPGISVIWPDERPVVGKYFPVTIVNHGFIEVFDVETYIGVPSDYSVEIIGNPYIDTLKAQQSVVLYARVKSVNASRGMKSVKSTASTRTNKCFKIVLNGKYCYECGETVVKKIEPLVKQWGACSISSSSSGGGPNGGGGGGSHHNDPHPQEPDKAACQLPKFKLVRVDGNGKDVVKGIATDGQSQVKIVLDGGTNSKDYSNITDIEWKLSEPVGELDPKTIHSLQGVIYTAPSMFAPGDEKLHKLNVMLICKLNGEPTVIADAVTIELIRVPVLMVHGLNSNPTDCWHTVWDKVNEEGMYEFLSRYGYPDFLLRTVDYNYTHNETFETNKNVVGINVENFITELNDKSYVCSSVDIVGHSMGGLLTKLYIKNNPQKKHLFHKIITINTPHGGSQLGNLMNDPVVQFVRDIDDGPANWSSWPDKLKILDVKDIVTPPHLVGRWAINYAYDIFAPHKPVVKDYTVVGREKDDISKGAVHDLSIKNGDEIGNEIQYINDNSTKGVRCHAIVTSANPSTTFMEKLTVFGVNIIGIPKTLGFNSVESLLNHIFDNDDNDIIVAVKSQKGGLSGDAISVLPSNKPGNLDYMHTSSCHNKDVKHEVLYLLGQSKDSKYFSDGFKTTEELNYTKLKWEDILKIYSYRTVGNGHDLYDKYRKYSPALFDEWSGKEESNLSRTLNINSSKYTNMSISADYSIGDTIVNVRVNPNGNYSELSFACFFNGTPIACVNSVSGIVRLPKMVKGDLLIVCEGKRSDGEWHAKSSTVPINTIGTATVTKISFVQNSVSIINEEYISPRVICTWSDGTVTEAVNPVLSVSNGNLARIEDNQYVYGKNSGRTMLNASYGDLTCSIPLEVYKSKGGTGYAEEEEGDTEDVCVDLSLSIKQKSVITRQAFRGTLTLNNNHPSMPLLNLKLQLEVRDMDGKLASEREFQISPESLNGDFEGNADFDSGWNLKSKGTGVATILFIPTKHAAPNKSKLWAFGGTLSYTDPFTGLTVKHNLRPVTLTVNPTPVLDMTYFLQRDVFGDDPMTEEQEPSQPAEFALLINNKGYGDAKDMKHGIKKPVAFDNRKGLAIDFNILNTQLNGKSETLAFSEDVPVDFGTIPAQSQTYAQWWLQSSLLGHFTEYDVTTTHVTSYGNDELSLLDQVTIHELVHGFTPQTAVGMNVVKRGFLVNDIEDSNDLPDRVYFTDGTQQPVYMAANATANSQGAMKYLLTVSPDGQGWVYASLDDPTGGKMRVTKAIRQSDGAEIPADNFWQTDRTLRDGKAPRYENRLHFVGCVESAIEQYLLTFEPKTNMELVVEAYEGVPEEGTELEAPLTDLTVRFNKSIDEAAFTAEDLKLYCDGTPIDASGISISKVDDTSFRLSLGATTARDGYFVLMVQTQNITDSEGFAGGVSKEASWVQTGAMTPDSPIIFADAEVKRICVENWDTNGDRELSYAEAGAVTDLGTTFNLNKNLHSFDELQFFTGITEIPDNAFSGCMELESVKIPNNVRRLGRDAFESTKLKSIYIPASVTEPIWSTPFYACNELASIVVDSNNPVYDSRGNCNALIEKKTGRLIAGCMNTVIPDGVTTISQHAFGGAKGLTKIDIPHSVTSIEYEAFIATGLKEVMIPNSVKNLVWYANTFQSCVDLESIVVEAGNPYYDSRENCNAIIETATNRLFSGCQNTTIPASVKIIGWSAFDYAKKLKSIYLPPQLTAIERRAFCNTGISSIDIPKSVNSIGTDAFLWCYNLKDVTVRWSKPISITDDVFPYRANATLYVPKGCKAAYAAAEYWKDFKLITEEVRGDVNCDGLVNIADVTAATSFALGGQPKGCNRQTADLNQDGSITQEDINELVEMILNSYILTNQ